MESALTPLSPRRKTRQIMVGKVPVGGDAPISVQSMTKTDTRDVEATVKQIYDYAAAGCEIVRVSVPTKKAGEVFHEICARSPIPVVADIHFDYRLALVAADGGAACLRINPGNIGGQDRVKAVVDKAGEKGIPIRIGVNGGSLEKDLLEKFGTATPEAMVESALRHLELLEKEGFTHTKISLKASDVIRTVQAYRLLAKQVDYPFHLGITEAGTPWGATIRSSVGIGHPAGRRPGGHHPRLAHGRRPGGVQDRPRDAAGPEPSEWRLPHGELPQLRARADRPQPRGQRESSRDFARSTTSTSPTP